MERLSISVLCAGIFLGASSAAYGQSPAAQPTLEAAHAIQLFEEAGFPLEEGRPVNRCGKPSNPRIAFIDLNADGRAEAHIADVDPACYGKPGAWFAILAQQPDKSWKRLIGEDGIVGFERTTSAGWHDLSLEARDSACPGMRRFNGMDYGAPTACAGFAAASAAQEPISPPATARATAQANGPLSQQKLFDWPGDPLPEVAALSAAERETLFRAAGKQPVGGGKWTACTDDPSGFSEATVTLVRDLNGDGRPEAVVGDSGSFCNGHVGMNSTVLTQEESGAWRVIYGNQGFVNFLVSRGVDNFPDIETGLAYSCFPYFRWNGSEYTKIAQLDEQGRTCEPF